MTDEIAAVGSEDDHGLAPATRAIRAGRTHNGAALAPTVVPSTTFVTPTVEEGRRMATMVG